jgi:tetratricopeptide (TPR) repeat protein
LYLKKILILIFFLILAVNSAFADETIKAENNAYYHNNMGILYLKEKYYFGAIKEFQIAIDLNPKSQAAAAYYVNLGTTYEKIGYNELARPCFEKAVSINVLCFDYYLKLAENYKKLGIVNEKLTEFQNRKNSPLNDVIIGLLYIQKGQVSTGITILDIFCEKEPNLLITTGVKNYLNKITQEKM